MNHGTDDQKRSICAGGAAVQRRRLPRRSTQLPLYSRCEEHLKAWLLRVAINRCRDLTRAAYQKDTELDENLPAPEQMPDGSVLDAVRTLPENYRNSVYLHYYEGYTAAEIGRMMKVPTNAA